MASVRLQSLKLKGFKSFPDQVELTFPGAVSAIIGPNGCGKSNIVDAMLWVLGEQSPSLLRLKNMGDVVFSGASGRKPAGSAEIVMVLRSEDGRWEEQDGRLEIRRRVLRSGPSEYRMNGKVVRLKDIVDELLSLGLGTRNYAIIEQGRVGQVLSARPTDRRVLLEEAAGITRYKVRRHESELKLEHTRQNLIRLDDVIDEVNRSLRQLKRQAKQAERYQAMQEGLTAALRSLHVIEAHELSHRRAEMLKSRAVCQNEVAAAASNLAGADADLQSARKGLEANRHQLEEARTEVSRLEASKEGLEAFLERSADLLDSLRSSMDRNHLDSAAAEEAGRVSAVALKEAISRRGTYRESLEQTRKRLQEARAEEASVREALDAQEAIAARSREDLLRTISTLTTSRNRLNEMEREQDRLAYAGGQLEQEGERLDERRRDVCQRHGEAVARVREALEAAGALEETRAKLVRERSQAREQAQESKQDAESLSHQVWEYRHRLSGVERELARHTAAADSLVDALGKDAVLGLVGDFLRPQADRASELDRVWGPWLELPVVDEALLSGERLADLSGLDERIRLALAGGDRVPEAWPELDGAQSFLEAAGVPDEHRPWLLRTVPPAYRCDDPDRARELAEQYPDVLILDSEDVLRHGRVIEPESQAVRRRGALALRQERQQLQASIEEAAGKAETTSARHRDLSDHLHSIDARLVTGDREVALAEEERARTAAVERSLGEERERLEKEATALTRERERTAANVNTMAGRREKLVAEVGSLENRTQDLEQGLEALTEALAGARENAGSALRGVDRWRAEERLAGERDAAAAQEEDRLQTEVHLLEGRILTLQKQREEFAKELGNTEDEVVNSRTRLVEEQALSASAKQQARHLTEAAETVTGKVEKLEVEVRRRRDEHERLREQLHEMDMDVTSVEGEWARLRDACMADLGTAPEALVDLERPEGPPAEELRAQTEKLRAGLEKIGPVNLLALKELDELSERSTFLSDQRKDLVDALKSLDETIKEIDGICIQRFVSTFEKVNALFCETFSFLFGGGTARLDLVDEDNPLGSGLDITAQPPGKKNQSVQLLSGGEKALTALALLIALFRIKPSPFCILDEVDAPLDDANVERLAELVHSMTEHTQFVMITHNRRTMQRSDVLYGVTMEEPGVSKVVSVRLEE
ncbi:MAG: chromosome segregation protein SMC [Acidobacteria bacterium]|nr:MAG: chromosome segregation protein SMC [Acidobacteriota bacterium]